MKPKYAVVVTTIGNGAFLDGYTTSAEAFHDQILFYVIPDYKTPPALYEKCSELRGRGFKIECPTLEEQQQYLARFGTLAQLVPYNSDNRRNVGYLKAIECGAPVVISLDDDNFCIPEQHCYDEFGCVSQGKQPSAVANASNGWLNICDMLALEPANRIYPRGFPYLHRHQRSDITMDQKISNVHLNAGLWLGEPDLDAMTWLVAPVKATSFREKSYVLGRDTWSPINTQNTSIYRDAMTSYYFVRMGYPLGGMAIDRYGDIFSGYFCQACVKAMGAAVRVGTPIADHRRNSHNYLKDAGQEMICILVLEELLAWLPSLQLPSTSYADAYLALADAIEDVVQQFKGVIWTDATRGYFHQMAYCMRKWVMACKILNGSSGV